MKCNRLALPLILRTLLLVAILAQALSSTRTASAADELHVMTSGAFTAAYLTLAPEFERATGHRLVVDATSMGVGATGIPARLARGEVVDVVIVAGQDLEPLIAAGLVRPGSRVDLARSSIGMAVRSGAPKPDISTVSALKETLLSASSIAYSASVSGTYLSTELFSQLGVAEQVLPRSRRIEGERVGAVVARGEAEIGFQQLSELLPISGIDVVGPLPAAVQRVTVFAAGIATASPHPESALALIAYLGSTAAHAAIRKSALEPVTSP